MFTSLEDFENSNAFVVFLIVVVPLWVFALWTFIMWITSRVSGWRDLARHYPYDNQETLDWMYRGGGGVYRASLPFAGVRGRLGVGATRLGILIKPPFILGRFYPALLLPYDAIVSEEPKTIFTLDFVILTMRDAPEVRVGILKSAKNMVEKVQNNVHR